MEPILFEKVWSIEKGGKIVSVRNVGPVTVIFEPYMELPESAELNFTKG